MQEGKKGILRAIPMFLCVGAACCALQSFYRVSEQEQAVVTRFGKVNDIKTAGMYFKVPFIDQVQKVDTTTYGMPIGYTITNERNGENPDYETTSDSLTITSDFNLVNTDFYLEYKLNPLITKKRIFYEAMEDVLPELKVIISDGSTQTMMPLESFADISVEAADGGDENGK